MKRFSILLFCALLIIASLAFVSCDQQSVDDTLNNLMEQSAEIFEPVFKKTESSSENDNSTNDDEDLSQDSEGEEQINQEQGSQGSTNQESQDNQGYNSSESDDQITSDTTQDENL